MGRSLWRIPGPSAQLTGASTQSREGVFQSRGCSYVGGVEKVPVPVDHLDCPPPVTIHDFTDADAILQQRRSREMLQIVQPQPGYACRAACILERPRHGVGVVGAFRGRVGGEDIAIREILVPQVGALASERFSVILQQSHRLWSECDATDVTGLRSLHLDAVEVFEAYFFRPLESRPRTRGVVTLGHHAAECALAPATPLLDRPLSWMAKTDARSAGVVQRPRERARSSGFQSEVFTFGVELDLYPLISKAPTG